MTDNVAELKAFAQRFKLDEAPPISEAAVPTEPPITPTEPSAALMESLAKLPKRHVCVALLSYDAKGFMRSQMALTNAIAKFSQLGWGFTYILRESDSMVARGRSQLASRFLTHPGTQACTDLVFIDTDVYWDGDDLLKLMSHEVPVVAGAYPFKNESGNFPLRWSSEGLLEEHGLWIVQAVTPGFLRIRRDALERMTQEMPWLEYKDVHGDADHPCYMFFDNLHRHNGVYDEGYIFCERWRGVGGRVYLDPDIDLKHVGMKIFSFGTIRRWNDEMTEEIEKLHRDFRYLQPGTLMKALQENRIHWRRLREVKEHEAALEKMRLGLAEEQAKVMKDGAQPITLDGLKYSEAAE